MAAERSREEHLAWAKARALAYLDTGELREAVASMGSDLRKHSAFQNHTTDLLLRLGVMNLSDRRLAHPANIRRWIEGFQ